QATLVTGLTAAGAGVHAWSPRCPAEVRAPATPAHTWPPALLAEGIRVLLPFVAVRSKVYGLRSLWLATHRDRLQDAERETDRDQRAATVRDERKRDTGHRHKRDGQDRVHQDLEKKHCRHPAPDQHPEGIL